MKYVSWAFLLLAMSACLSTKNFKENEYLLAPPVVKGNQILPAEDFMYMHRQKPNGKFIFWSKVGLYQFGEKRFSPDSVEKRINIVDKKWSTKIRNAEDRQDSIRSARYTNKKINKLKRLNRKKKEGNWFMRVVGEAPVYFDSMAVVKTAIEMNKLLKTKGFFQGQVSFEVEEPRPKHKRAVYSIKENIPTFLDTVIYQTTSPTIDSLLKAHHREKNLKKGAYYNTAHIDSERYRVEQLLRNNGFIFFSRQYISFRVDTTHFQTFANFNHTNYTDAQQDSIRKIKREAKIKVIIDNPANGEHLSFNVDEVFMHQVTPQKKHLEPDTLTSKNTHIQYVYVGKTLRHEYHVLDKRIRTKPKELYSAQKIIDTQNALNILDLYKFVNVKTDTINNKLHLHFFTSSLNRYQLTFEGGGNVAQGLPGPFVNLTLKNRNIFGGAEFLETSLRFLIDGQQSFTGSRGIYSSQEIGGNVALNFPRILFPSALMPRKLRENVYSYNPVTKISLGYGFTRRPEYTRSNLVGAISYKGQLKRATYNITLAELSIISTERISETFQATLNDLERQGNPIKFSFVDALVGSSYFTYTYTSTTDVKSKNSYYFRILLELGGNTLRFLDRQFDPKNNLQVFNLPYFQFYRINPTFHYYIPRPKERFWAFRANAGIAFPYGKSNVLPYEKYYFAGGSNSVRAWGPRRLGVGELTTPRDSSGRPDYKREKPGEIILEANAEYRFPLYQGWIEGAAFLDAGNVWALREDETTKGGKFNFSRLHQQIAIGTGFGIRMDFSFLIFRTDIGIKIHDPGRKDGERWVLAKYKPTEYFQQRILNFNLAVGYPF
jgi:outer membrane protein assembly factor BamA